MEKAVTQLTPPGFQLDPPFISLSPSLLLCLALSPYSLLLLPNQLSQTKKILLLEEMLQGDHPLEDDEFRPSIDALKYAHRPPLSPKPEISEYQVAYVS